MAATIRALLLLFLSCLLLHAPAQDAWKITDTVYYNPGWQICEEPIATFYRVGVLAGTSRGWYFTGPVKDFTRDHQLMLEGEYDGAGRKQGTFRSYHGNGQLLSEGQFEGGAMTGVWKWFHPNGKERAVVYFPEGEDSFKFISCRDSNGKASMENGIGEFDWTTQPLNDGPNYYKVRGHFAKGLRVKNWDFIPVSNDGLGHSKFTEVYNEDGSYKKTKHLTIRDKPFPIHFVPARLGVMERMEHDAFFHFEGDSARVAVLSYLIEKKTAPIYIPKKTFDSSFNVMLRLLNAMTPAFGFGERDISGTIEFRIGPAGFPEDISVSATNADSAEVRLLYFLMNKFRKIEMPSEGNIALEAYHKIHFYVLRIRDYLPAELRGSIDKDLVFSHYTREENVKRLEADKKKIKRYLRRNYAGYR
ncbi:MAG: hypothetical protein EOO16_14300 [Chitinophagaceae bacterium]|nr:MAG: hypothetical protein EOO16_14300 [Chitinophagaceae bacterium]